MKRNIPYFIGLILAGISIFILWVSYNSYAAALGLVVYVSACIQSIGQE